MRLTRFFIAALAILLTANAFAVRPNYNYLGAGYARQHLDGGCEQDGLFLEGSFTLNELVYFHGHHVDVTSNSWCGSTSTALSLGVRGDMGRQGSLYGLLTMINRDYGADSDAGFGATVGLRGFMSPGLEARGFLAYEGIDSQQQTLLGGGVNYWFNPAFSLNGELTVSDENQESLQLGLRFNFF